MILPSLIPALLTGFALAFARAVGEYGSVIFIAGNLPNVSEIAPLLIVIRLSEFRYADATAIAVVMLVASFLIIFAVNRLQRWAQTAHPGALSGCDEPTTADRIQLEPHATMSRTEPRTRSRLRSSSRSR